MLTARGASGKRGFLEYRDDYPVPPLYHHIRPTGHFTLVYGNKMFFTGIATAQYTKSFPDSVPAALWSLPPCVFVRSGLRTPEARGGSTSDRRSVSCSTTTRVASAYLKLNASAAGYAPSESQPNPPWRTLLKPKTAGRTAGRDTRTRVCSRCFEVRAGRDIAPHVGRSTEYRRSRQVNRIFRDAYHRTSFDSTQDTPICCWIGI